MIRNEKEYQVASQRSKEEQARLDEHRAKLSEEGFSEDQIKNVMDPLTSFHLQLVDELTAYERLKSGKFDELVNLRGLGQLLISLRIYLGISQRDLANKLGVHESQVSRDERNDYFGIKVERVNAVLEALGVQLNTKVELTPRDHAARFIKPIQAGSKEAQMQVRQVPSRVVKA